MHDLEENVNLKKKGREGKIKQNKIQKKKKKRVFQEELAKVTNQILVFQLEFAQVAKQLVKSEIKSRQSGKEICSDREESWSFWYDNIGAGERNTRNQDVNMKSWFEKRGTGL
jgi:uncharacterized protein YihD (DUF1040 family)